MFIGDNTELVQEYGEENIRHEPCDYEITHYGVLLHQARHFGERHIPNCTFGTSSHGVGASEKIVARTAQEYCSAEAYRAKDEEGRVLSHNQR